MSVTTPAWLVLPGQTDTPGGLAPASLSLRNHQPGPAVPVHLHTPWEPRRQRVQREKAILHPEQQSLPKPPAVALRIHPGWMVEGGRMGWPVPGEPALGCSC